MLQIGNDKVYTQREMIDNIRAFGKSIAGPHFILSKDDICVVLSIAMEEDVDFLKGILGNYPRE